MIEISKQSKLLKFFCSARFAAILFLLLAALILLGTIIPQEPQVGVLALKEKFGDNYSLLASLGFTDVFHSGWYLFLLFCLALNLVLVSFVKVFPRAKKAFLWPRFINVGTSLIKRTSPAVENFEATVDLENWPAIIANLKRRGWAVKTDFNQKSLLARKGAYHRFGPSITHIGILTILVGAFLSLLLGFNGVVQGVPGERFILSDRQDSLRSYILVETSTVFHSPIWLGLSPEFELELGKTSRQDYKNGNPKQWTSDLLFFDNKGNPLYKSTAAVNQPVNFKGVDFFQADWKRILRLDFNSKQLQVDLNKITDTLEAAYVPANEGLGLLFLHSLQKPNVLSVLSLITPSSDVPADLSIKKNIEQGNYKFLGELALDEALELGPMKIVFQGVFSETGIQYKKSPGDWLMIGGMVILLCGVFIAFGAKRVLWIYELNAKKLAILGNTDRLPDSFRQEFDALLELFKSIK